MSEEHTTDDTGPAVVEGVRVRRHRGQRRRARERSMLTLWVACTILGVTCTGWALVNIRAQSGTLAWNPGTERAHSRQQAAAAAAQATMAVETAPAKKARADKVRSTPKIVFAKNPAKGDTLGILSIPTLGQTLPIIEGTRTRDLKKGIGHFSQSVQPGQVDNCVVSGHRDSFFSRLGELEKGLPRSAPYIENNVSRTHTQGFDGPQPQGRKLKVNELIRLGPGLCVEKPWRRDVS